MRMDKTLEIYGETRTPDGMGGWTVNKGKIGEIQAFITPLKLEKAINNYGTISKHILKVFTKDTINENITILIDGKFYKILQLNKHKRMNVLSVELV